MTFQIVQSPEQLTTILITANEWFVTVYCDMCDNVACLCETLITNVTHLRPLSGVCSDVIFQISRFSELLTTILPTANKCFVFLVILAVRFLMIIVTESTVEAPATDVTYIQILFHVNSGTTFKWTRFPVPLTTNRPPATVWFDSLVMVQVISQLIRPFEHDTAVRNVGLVKTCSRLLRKNSKVSNIREIHNCVVIQCCCSSQGFFLSRIHRRLQRVRDIVTGRVSRSPKYQ
jgi:hypothetical protein